MALDRSSERLSWPRRMRWDVSSVPSTRRRHVNGNGAMELGMAEAGNKVLGSRTLIHILPPAFLSVVVLMLLAAGAPETPMATRLVKTLKDFQGPQFALLLLAVLVAAVILQPFQVAVVQLLEGYWVDSPIARSGQSSLVRRVSDIGIELQRRRYQFLRMIRDEADNEAEASPKRLHDEQTDWADAEIRYYPELDSRLMPTQLGNVLRAAEDRPDRRYGLSTNVIYPRLFLLLPDRLAAALASSNNQLDMAAHLTVTLIVTAAVSAGLLLPNGWHNAWWLLIPPAAGVLAWLSYRAAIRAARSQSRLLETAFDLHRFDLLSALHYRLPTDPWSEYQFNRQLSNSLATLDASVPSTVLAMDYQHPVDEDGSVCGHGPFQPFRWDWDFILTDSESGNRGEQSARQPRR
jgi:hypothetical protein